MEEGMIEAQFDELMDPRPGREGKVWHFISVKKPGMGTAEIFISEELYKRISVLRLGSGDHIGLVYKLSKFQGKFEPRLSEVVALAMA